jgi:hypothetical protein
MPRDELRTDVIALLRNDHNKRRPRARGHCSVPVEWLSVNNSRV